MVFDVERYIERAKEHINSALDCEATEEGMNEEDTLLEIAVELCNIVLVHDKIAEAYDARATALSAQGNPKAAVEDARKAVELEPDNVDYQVGLGEVLINLGKTDEAVVCFNKALMADPHDIIANQNLGEIYFTKGDFSRALSYFKRVDDADPDGPDMEANIYLARCNELLGDVNLAITYYQCVLDIMRSIPDDERHYLNYLNASFAERVLEKLGVDVGHRFEQEALERKVLFADEINLARLEQTSYDIFED